MDLLRSGILGLKLSEIERYVRPELAAPTISSSQVLGFIEDGEIVEVAVDTAGYPEPFLYYQWQNNGVNLVGETSSTILLDETSMGLTNGDSISCEITAVNTLGQASDEPTATFISSVLPDLLTLLNGSSNCSIIDGRLAQTSPTFVAPDQSNNSNDFTPTIAGREPDLVDGQGMRYPADTLCELETANESTASTIVMRISVDLGDNDYFITPGTRGWSAFGSAIPYTTTVDGVSVTNAQELYTALSDGALHTVKMLATTDSKIGRTNAAWGGRLYKAVLIDELDITGVDYSNAVSKAETWVAE